MYFYIKTSIFFYETDDILLLILNLMSTSFNSFLHFLVPYGEMKLSIFRNLSTYMPAINNMFKKIF